MTHSSATRLVTGMLLGFSARLDSLSAIKVHLLSERALYKTLQNVFVAIKSGSFGSLSQAERVLLALILGLQADGTHTNLLQSPLAGATAYTVQLVKSDEQPINFMSEIWRRFSGSDDDFDNTLRRIGHVLGNGSAVHSLRHIAHDKTLNSVYVQALYCVMRSPENYEDALRTALQAPFEPQLVAILVSSYLILRLGLEQVDTEWMTVIEQDIDIENYALMIAKL